MLAVDVHWTSSLKVYIHGHVSFCIWEGPGVGLGGEGLVDELTM